MTFVAPRSRRRDHARSLRFETRALQLALAALLALPLDACEIGPKQDDPSSGSVFATPPMPGGGSDKTGDQGGGARDADASADAPRAAPSDDAAAEADAAPVDGADAGDGGANEGAPDAARGEVDGDALGG